MHQTGKKICIGIGVFGYENKEENPVYQKILSKDMSIYYWQKKKAKGKCSYQRF